MTVQELRDKLNEAYDRGLGKTDVVVRVDEEELEVGEVEIEEGGITITTE